MENTIWSHGFNQLHLSFSHYSTFFKICWNLSGRTGTGSIFNLLNNEIDIFYFYIVSQKVACVLYKHSDEHLFLFSLAFTLYTIYFLSIKFWQAISVTKIIIWLMTLFLSLHWCLEMSAQSMFARNSPVCL